VRGVLPGQAWSGFVASVLGTVVVAKKMHAISKMYRHIDHGQVVDALERRYAQELVEKDTTRRTRCETSVRADLGGASCDGWQARLTTKPHLTKTPLVEYLLSVSTQQQSSQEQCYTGCLEG
jgi:hypothetical protein